MPGRTFSREFKLDVIREIEEGRKRPAQACREYQLAGSVLTRWRQEYRQRGEELTLQTASALQHFSHLAHKATDANHPLDRQRWFSFVITAHYERASPDAYLGFGEERNKK